MVGPAGACLVAGVDGCRAGWVVATVPAGNGDGQAEAKSHVQVEVQVEVEVEVVHHLSELARRIASGELEVATIDIPIGLAELGPRACDRAARSMLGPRRSSVFPAPARAVLGAATYEEACTLSQAVSGKRISKQLYNILPKIREADETLARTPGVRERIFEMSPELSFAVLAGAPLRASKRTAAGRAERLEALRRGFPGLDAAAIATPSGAQADDVLDALAGAWTARRVVAGTHLVLGGETDEMHEIDEAGLRMAVVA